MNEKISILLPAKNAASFLEECLNSILNQSEKDWELFIIDDHSVDHSFEILKEFQQKDERIKPLKNKGKGIIDALKTACWLTIFFSTCFNALFGFSLMNANSVI